LEIQAVRVENVAAQFAGQDDWPNKFLTLVIINLLQAGQI